MEGQSSESDATKDFFLDGGCWGQEYRAVNYVNQRNQRRSLLDCPVEHHSPLGQPAAAVPATLGLEVVRYMPLVDDIPTITAIFHRKENTVDPH